MAQIELRIVAAGPDDLHETLKGLVSGSVRPTLTHVAAEVATPEVTPQVAREVSDGTKRRGRPLGSKNLEKPEAPVAPTEAPVASAPAPIAPAEAPVASAPAPIAPASPASLFDAPVEPAKVALVAPQAPATPGGPSHEDVRAKLQELVARYVIDGKPTAGGRDKAMDILRSVGSSSITKLPFDKYAEVIALTELALQSAPALA